jgi:phosphoglycolate phosphatase-like HAD superfamily hydrolase
MRPDQLQAVIFDFDGVLVESADIKTRAFAELYAPCGAEVVRQIVAYHRANAGKSRYLKFRYCQERILGRPPLSGAEERDLDRRFSELVVEQVVAAPAVAGAEALLRRWHDTVPLFVASGTPQEELRAIIERRGMRGWFTGVYGAPATKTEIIAAVIAGHGCQSSRVLVIGDAMSDFEGALANHALFLGRVPKGEAGPFPKQVVTVPDLQDIEVRLAGLAVIDQ